MNMTLDQEQKLDALNGLATVCDWTANLRDE